MKALGAGIVGLAALILCASAADAGPRLSVRGGIVRADVETEGRAWETEPIWTASAGGACRFPLDRPLFYELEALYVQKGASFRIGDSQGETALKYLTFSNLVGLRLNVGRVSAFWIGGVEMGFRLVARYRQETPTVSESDLRPRISDSDLGIVIGGGLQLPIGKSAFEVQVRYVFGIPDIHADPDGGGPVDWRNRSIYLLLCVYP